MSRITSYADTFRYVVLGVIVLVTSLLENTLSVFSSTPNFKLYLTICVVVAIGVLEDEIASASLGLFAGLLSDIFSSNLGFNSIFMMFLGLFVSLIISHFMRSTVFTSLIFSSISIGLYVFAYWAIFVIGKGLDGGFQTLFTLFIPRWFMTVLVSPFIYILVRRMRKNLI